MSDVVTAIVQVVTAVGGLAGIGAALRWGADRRASKAKTSIDTIGATKALTDIAVSLLTPLRSQVDELVRDLALSRAEVVTLRDDVRGLHEWISLLISALEAAGQPVPPRPTPLSPAPSPTPHPRGGPSSESEPPP